MLGLAKSPQAAPRSSYSRMRSPSGAIGNVLLGGKVRLARAVAQDEVRRHAASQQRQVGRAPRVAE